MAALVMIYYRKFETDWIYIKVRRVFGISRKVNLRKLSLKFF